MGRRSRWAEGTEVAGLVGALCVFMVVRGAIAAEDPPSLGTRVNCRVGTSITGRPKITRRGPLGAAGEDGRGWDFSEGVGVGEGAS